MLRSKFLVAISLVAAAAIAMAPVGSAESRFTLGGWIELSGANEFTHTMTNPEANFNKTCARGSNGWASWLRVGKQFPIFNGVGDRVGSVRITKAEWVEDYGLKGNCYYYMYGKGLKRANFYCIAMPNGYTWEIGSANKAKRGFVEVDLWLINAQWATPYKAPECRG